MISISEKKYQLNDAECYTGNLHISDSIIEGCQYSMALDRASESLLLQNYSLFILTIGCIGVSIILKMGVVGYLIGTCVLLEVPSIQSLDQYFQALTW